MYPRCPSALMVVRAGQSNCAAQLHRSPPALMSRACFLFRLKTNRSDCPTARFGRRRPAVELNSEEPWTDFLVWPATQRGPAATRKTMKKTARSEKHSGLVSQRFPVVCFASRVKSMVRAKSGLPRRSAGRRETRLIALQTHCLPESRAELPARQFSIQSAAHRPGLRSL